MRPERRKMKNNGNKKVREIEITNIRMREIEMEKEEGRKCQKMEINR